MDHVPDNLDYGAAGFDVVVPVRDCVQDYCIVGLDSGLYNLGSVLDNLDFDPDGSDDLDSVHDNSDFVLDDPDYYYFLDFVFSGVHHLQSAEFF